MNIVSSRTLFGTFALALLLPCLAAAQQVSSASPQSPAGAENRASQQSNVPAGAQRAEAAVEATARRFRFGVNGGVGLDPELIDMGAHVSFGPIFRPQISFRPGIELGLGEVTTLFGINLDVLYTLSGDGETRWSPYFGAGPNFALSHRGFETDVEDNNDEDRNRFDFSDTDFSGGFNFIAGARNDKGLFIEMKATAYGVSNIRLLAGFNF